MDAIQKGLSRGSLALAIGAATCLDDQSQAEVPERAAGTAATPSPLWLAIELPALALTAAGLNDRQEAWVIADGERDARVWQANRAAQALGVVTGMRVNAARALGDLRVRGRSEIAELDALRVVATWSLQFTAVVSLEPPAILLLEVGRSLTLFKGLAALIARIKTGLTELGHAAVLAVAPTPLAALCFAHARQTVCITRPEQLRMSLGRLPVTCLATDARMVAAFAGLGLRSIGDCLRLPRAGLARRFGPVFLALLDRALGQHPDPRTPFAPPDRFERRVELAYEAEAVETLQPITGRLIAELADFLRARGAGAQCMDWTFMQRDQQEIPVRIALAAASRDPAHLQQLLVLRLSQWRLPAPVRAIRLSVTDLQPLAETSASLLPGTHAQQETQPWVFIERLCARLGVSAVRGLRVIADHRPEAAWAFCAPGATGAPPAGQCRPAWLLQAPQLLSTRAGKPYLRGILEPLGRGERIEGGWWDGVPVARDYFNARHPAGNRYWIFREVEGERRWFLHGIFD
jgi:protein ImuB